MAIAVAHRCLHCAREPPGAARTAREVDSRGATLFAERCAGCHTLEAAGTEGSNPEERVAGPNLNNRRETKDQVLYAIRNGGFSGAIMPQNIVVGEDAEAVAEFVAKYAGKSADGPAGPDPGRRANEIRRTGQSGAPARAATAKLRQLEAGRRHARPQADPQRSGGRQGRSRAPRRGGQGRRAAGAGRQAAGAAAPGRGPPRREEEGLRADRPGQARGRGGRGGDRRVRTR